MNVLLPRVIAVAAVSAVALGLLEPASALWKNDHSMADWQPGPPDAELREAHGCRPTT